MTHVFLTPIAWLTAYYAGTDVVAPLDSNRRNRVLGITPPSGGELLVLLIMVAMLGAIVAGMVALFRLASHRGTGSTASTAPSDQQPPPGY